MWFLDLTIESTKSPKICHTHRNREAVSIQCFPIETQTILEYHHDSRNTHDTVHVYCTYTHCNQLSLSSQWYHIYKSVYMLNQRASEPIYCIQTAQVHFFWQYFKTHEQLDSVWVPNAELVLFVVDGEQRLTVFPHWSSVSVFLLSSINVQHLLISAEWRILTRRISSVKSVKSVNSVPVIEHAQ